MPTVAPAMTWFGIGTILCLSGIIRIVTYKESRKLWKQILIPPAMLMSGFLTAKMYWNCVYDILAGPSGLSPVAAQDIIVGLCGVTPPLMALFVWRITRRKQEIPA